MPTSSEFSTTASSKIGSLLRQWTKNSLRRSAPKSREASVAAANALSRVGGQPFPEFGYRVIEIPINKVRGWKDLVEMLDAKYPEACSMTLNGAQRFLKEASGGHHPVGIAATLVIRLRPKQWMFNVPYLTKRLTKEEQIRLDLAGFSLKEYLPHEEVVAAPGSLKASLLNGSAYLEGYSNPGSPMNWVNSQSAVKL